MPIADEVKREKRLKDITWWFEEFAKNTLEKRGISITYDDGAEEKINNEYWGIVENQIRPQLEEGVEATIDRHKIISTTEILIAIRCPITTGGDQREKKSHNADLALYVAMNIFLNFCRIKDIPKSASSAMKNFRKSHRTWLQKIGLEGRPYFSNAATWYLLEELCLIASKIDNSTGHSVSTNLIED